jgi:hypothetical protein
MTNKTKGNRTARRVGSLAVMAAVATLTAACSLTSSSPQAAQLRSSPSPGSETDFQANVAFAHCMQSHGVPNFPNPSNAGQTFSVNLQASANTVSGRATIACKHLLPSGTSPNSGESQTQLEQTLKIVQCLHSHGEPNVPDPTIVNGTLEFSLQPSEVQSAQFQSALKACESLLPKGVHLK